MSTNNHAAILAALTPDIYQRFLTAVEIGRWPDGKSLSPEQRATCMEAIIVYENHHLPPEQRTGYVPPKVEPCADESHIHSHEQPLTWK